MISYKLSLLLLGFSPPASWRRKENFPTFSIIAMTHNAKHHGAVCSARIRFSFNSSQICVAVSAQRQPQIRGNSATFVRPELRFRPFKQSHLLLPKSSSGPATCTGRSCR